MRRLAIAFFYDEHGIVDDYMPYLMRAIGEFSEKTIFVSNGPITPQSEVAVRKVADEVIIRENVGFDVWAYKQVLEHVGYENLAKYDEVMLYNHTIYGPFFPLSEMFEVMDKRKCDFWGMTSHKSMVPNPFTKTGRLPEHINSHFIAVRKRMLKSPEFKEYWDRRPKIESYTDSVLKHESIFTEHFEQLGFSSSTYVDNKRYTTEYPIMMEVQDVVANRCPIIKRRLFFHDHYFFEENGTDIPLALETLRNTSDYPEEMMWKSALRVSKLRNLNVNVNLMRVLPDEARVKKIAKNRYGKVAVCAHIYYVEMLEEILAKTDNIPVPYDFIASTDTPAKAKEIRRVAKKRKNIAKVIVRVVEMNRGRDMSALFITCRDIFLDSEYDLVCRLHTKKSPQLDRNIGNMFKRHLIENLLHSRGYVTNLLEEFRQKPWIGVAVPPIVNVSFCAIGQSWFANKAWCQDLVRFLDLKVELDPTTPVATYGTMFWFRPKALHKLFLPKWEWSLFSDEPHHIDGGLAHVLERIICYAAQDAGFATLHVTNPDYAAQSYTVAEFKLDQLISKLPPNTVRMQAHMLSNWKEAGYPPNGYVDSFQIPRTHSEKHLGVRAWLHEFRVSLYPASNMIKHPLINYFTRIRTRLAATRIFGS